MSDAPVEIYVNVSNIDGPDGDEVVFVFLIPHADTLRASLGDVPIERRRLVAFERVHVASGETRSLHFTIEPRSFLMVDADGARALHEGDFALVVSRGHGEDAIRRDVYVRPSSMEREFLFHKWW